MDSKSSDKSRRERRKETRLGKNKKKFDSWIVHKQSQKKKKSSRKLKINKENILQKNTPILTEKEVTLTDADYDSEISLEQPTMLDKSKLKLEAVDHNVSNPLKGLKRTKVSNEKSKTKFQKYLEMDTQKDIAAEDDFALERKLAKKLKVKKGKLGGDEDDLNMLFEGIPSVLDSSGEEEARLFEQSQTKSLEKSSIRKQCKKKSLKKEVDVKMLTSAPVIEVSEPVKSIVAEATLEKIPSKVVTSEGMAKYVAPHLRSSLRNESEEYSQIRRRVRGLLNRLSESNVEAITGEVSSIFHSVARSIGSQLISEEILSSCSGGPRGNEQYAAVFASFVAGMACLVGMDFSAKLLASLAKSFEDEYSKEDNLSLRNITLLLSYLYTFGVCSSDLIYDLMITLSKQLTEVDVSTILTILQCCGMKLRSDDPAIMKNFILSVQNRVAELKASSENGHEITKSKRMEFMLETICDIKNNKKRSKEDTLQHTRIKKWLQKLTGDNISIRGVKWSKLVDPNKKGQWWLSGDNITSTTEENIEEVANKIDGEIPEAQKMLQLAAAQRMNTDARRAIFCIIMSGEDYVDTFEKLLRLDLPGKQDREIMRVLVECCLQERVFNKYYCVLASKLCSHDKNHKFTLQYCLWDHFKELESMQLIRSMNLSKFVAEMLATFSLSLSFLKVVDLDDATLLTAKRIMHFRMLFEAIFEFPDRLIWNMFTRIAVTPDYESLRNGIQFFVSKYVLSTKKSLAEKFRVAKKALNNVEGVLL